MTTRERLLLRPVSTCYSVVTLDKGSYSQQTVIWLNVHVYVFPDWHLQQSTVKQNNQQFQLFSFHSFKETILPCFLISHAYYYLLLDCKRGRETVYMCKTFKSTLKWCALVNQSVHLQFHPGINEFQIILHLTTIMYLLSEELTQFMDQCHYLLHQVI